VNTIPKLNGELMINLKNLFYFDIETTGRYPDYITFAKEDLRGAALFETKYLKKSLKDSASWPNLEESYLKNATLLPEYGQIVCVSMAYYKNEKLMMTSEHGDDEQQIVYNCASYFNKISDLNMTLCGFNIKGFDMPWMLKKFCKYGIPVPSVLNVFGKKPWEVNVLDLMDTWKGTAFESCTFDELCYMLEIPSPKEGAVRGSNLHKYYWDHLDTTEIAAYCERDVSCLVSAAEKLSNLI